MFCILTFQSVRECAKQVLDEYPQLHVLVNNGGFAPPVRNCGSPLAVLIFVWHQPQRASPPLCHQDGSVTQDGFESGLGAMHLAHFLLTVPSFAARDVRVLCGCDVRLKPGVPLSAVAPGVSFAGMWH